VLRPLRMVLPVAIILLGTILAISIVVGPERLPVVSRWVKPPPDPAPVSLRETFDLLRRWHRQGSYARLRPYIEPESRETVMDLLIVIEELRAASAAALEAGQASCPAFDWNPLRRLNLLGAMELFSGELSVTDVTESGATGTVTAVIGSPPVVSLSFRRIDHRWVYVPGKTMAEAVPILRELSQALARAVAVFRSRPHTRAEIEEEYRFRIDPKLQQLKTVVPGPFVGQK